MFVEDIEMLLVLLFSLVMIGRLESEVADLYPMLDCRCSRNACYHVLQLGFDSETSIACPRHILLLVSCIFRKLA